MAPDEPQASEASRSRSGSKQGRRGGEQPGNCAGRKPRDPPVNLVASTFTNGASMSFASRRAISVLPHPVGPIMRMLRGMISSCVRRSASEMTLHDRPDRRSYASLPVQVRRAPARTK